MNTFELIKENWMVIATALFAISEVLALIPKIKANSVFQAVYNVLLKIINFRKL